MPRKPNTTGEHYNDPFPTNLRELIKNNKTTQEELTAVLNVKTRQSVTGYIDGSTLPTIDKVVALADFFNVSVDYLLGRTAPKTADHDLRFVCEYTGLSEQAIEFLCKGAKNSDLQTLYKSFLSELLEELCVVASGDNSLTWEQIANDVAMAGAAKALPEVKPKGSVWLSNNELELFFFERAVNKFSFCVKRVFEKMVDSFVQYAEKFSVEVKWK